MFTTIVESAYYETSLFYRDLSVVDPDWLYEASPQYFRKKKPNPG